MIYTRWLLYGVVAFVVIQLLLQSRYPPPQITSGFVRRDLTNPAKRPSPPKKRTKATNTLPAHLGRGNEATGCLHQWAPPPTTVAAVVILTCNRPAYLERTLNTLLEVHSHDPQYATKFPLFVSQDGNNSEVAETLHAYTDALWAMEHVELQEPQRRLNRNENLAYYRIANHYKFVFLQMFDCLGFSNLIILEDDMEIAIDFFSFFERAAFLLAHDPSLYVVSSWNDHGQEAHVRDPYRLYRTDFFPGLGWMMPRRLWEEFADKWPAAYWDDWMREPQQRRGRESVYPEVCRNYNFGEHGSSKGQFFSKYLKPIRLNTVPVPWKDVDLRYLESDRYAHDLHAALQGAPEVDSVRTFMDLPAPSGDIKLIYRSEAQWRTIARAFGILPEWKTGMPRSAYHGVVTLHWGNARVFLVPDVALQAKMLQTSSDADGAVNDN